MSQARPDLHEPYRGDEAPPLKAEELRPMIVDQPRLPGMAAIQPLQGLLDREGHRVGFQGQVQAPVHEEAAVPVQDVHQVIPPWRNVQVHEVDVPELVRMVRLRRPPQLPLHQTRPSHQEVCLLQDPVDLVRAEISHVLVNH